MSRSIRPTIPLNWQPQLTLKNGTVVPMRDWEEFYRPQTPVKPFLADDGTQAGWRWGIIARLGSFWVGVHYSKRNKRWCVNPVPCITFWLAAPGGHVPDGPDYDPQPQINHPLTQFP